MYGWVWAIYAQGVIPEALPVLNACWDKPHAGMVHTAFNAHFHL